MKNFSLEEGARQKNKFQGGHGEQTGQAGTKKARLARKLQNTK